MHICNTRLATVVFFSGTTLSVVAQQKSCFVYFYHTHAATSKLTRPIPFCFLFFLIPYRRSPVLFLFFETSHNHIRTPLSPGSSGCIQRCKTASQTAEKVRADCWLRRPDNGRLIPLPVSQTTSKQETYLCLYLTLISSVLSPLNKAICTFDKSLSGFCNWLPSDWTRNVLLERMKHI